MSTVSNLIRFENQNELAKRIKNSIDAVSDQQLFNGQNPKYSSNSKFNSYDSILAAKFKEITFNRNIYLKNLINFEGKDKNQLPKFKRQNMKILGSKMILKKKQRYVVKIVKIS